MKSKMGVLRMKKLIVILFILNGSYATAQRSQNAELFIYYVNSQGQQVLRPSPKHFIRITKDPILTIYDKNLLPLPDMIQTAFIDTEFYLNACYNQSSGAYGEVNPTGTNGTVFYGKYQIDFGTVDPVTHIFSPITGLTRFIDFRDDEYGYPINGGPPDGALDGYPTSQDFFVVCKFNLTTPSGSQIYFSASGANIDGLTGTGYGIWDIETKVAGHEGQHTTRFKNFKLNIAGVGSSPLYNATINGVNYSTSGNNPVTAGLGFNNPTSVSITVPNRLGSSAPYSYLTTWDGQALYTTNYSLSFDGNLLRTVNVAYKQSSLMSAVNGSTVYIGSTGNMTFYSTPGWSDLGPVLVYWYFKSDADAIWRQLITGTRMSIFFTVF